MNKLALTQIKSEHGRLKKHKDCLKGLGLRGLGSKSSVEDTTCNRGMIRKVSYMIRVE